MRTWPLFAPRLRLFMGLLAMITALFFRHAPAAEPAPEQIAGTVLSLEQYRGSNLAVLLFSIDEPRVRDAVDLMNELHDVRSEYNLAIAGVCLGDTPPERLQQFVHTAGVQFPVFGDQHRNFAKKVSIRGRLGLCLFDKHGRSLACKWAIYTPPAADLAQVWQAFMAKHLQIPYLPADVPVLGLLPTVPDLRGKALQGQRVAVRELCRDTPVVIVIFSPNCPHCRDELSFLTRLAASGDLKDRFTVVAISRGSAEKTAQLFAAGKYPFPVLIDGNGTYSARFPSYAGSVPLSYVVDREGRIVSMHPGFNRVAADLYRMELRRINDLPNPPLLDANGYSGHERCAVCHRSEHVQWSLTRHADAFLSLVRKGSEDDPACVSCHVTGFDKPGGYVDGRRSARLQDVQCEACHGPGHSACAAFPGATPQKKTAAEWKRLCRACHTEEESLNFVFPKRFARILHGNAPDVSSMDRRERLELLRGYREKKNLFDSPARYVGAGTCRECHQPEYRQWQQTRHAVAHTVPGAKNASHESVHRYHTGVDQPGGYPEPGREGVQCEACHGPGERHVTDPEAAGPGRIVSLKQSCSSCVVEQICRTCHSLEDDPQFDFETAVKKVRHAEAGAGQMTTAAGQGN